MNLKDMKKVYEDDKIAKFRNTAGHSFEISKSALKDKGLLAKLKQLPLHASDGVDTDPNAPRESDEVSAANQYSEDAKTDKDRKEMIAANLQQRQAQEAQGATFPIQGQAVGPQEQDGPPSDLASAQPIRNTSSQSPATISKPSVTDYENPIGPGTLGKPSDIGIPGQQLSSKPPAPLDPKQELDNEAVKTQQDLLNGHIKPETYQSLFAKKDTLGKIGTLFGLLVSGAGSGLSHQPNAVMEMMNKEIQNDLDAQKTTASNVQNLYHLNQQNELNKANVGLTKAQTKGANLEADLKANQLAYQQAVLFTNHHVQGLVDKMTQGQTKTAAQGAANNMQAASAAQIAQGNAKTASQINAVRATDPESAFKQRQAMLMQGPMMGLPQAAELGKTEAARHYPAFGNQVADHDLTPEDKDKLTTGIDFQQKLGRFIDWTKNHSGSVNPVDINTGKAMAAELQGAYRQATHGGVYKEGEQNFIGKIIKEDPTEFFNKIRVMPQLNALQNEHQARMSNVANSMGFDYSKALGQQGQSGEIRYDKQGQGWKMGPNGKPVRAQ